MMKVNEIFESFQFEGSRSGTWNTFIRFSGCNRHCDFCDTDHSSFYNVSPKEVAEQVKTKNVILTGGEPLFQPEFELVELTELLQDANKYVAMETNGDLIGFS